MGYYAHLGNGEAKKSRALPILLGQTPSILCVSLLACYACDHTNFIEEKIRVANC